MTATHKLEIRPVIRTDLVALDRTFVSEYRRTHADDMADQNEGKKIFLVAWMDDRPVGHVLVDWRGARQPEPVAAFPNCPEIYRLAVLEDYQRRGIATSLIARCEAEARTRRFDMIGLGTDPSVPADHNLYYRLGYVDSGVGIFDDVYNVERDGKVITVREDTRFVIKQL